MDGTERPKRRPSIEVRCPKCGTRAVDGGPNRGCLLVLLAALAIDLMVLRGCMALAAALAG